MMNYANTNRYGRWNPLKTKQIQTLTVVPIWQPSGRPAGRPTDHPEKSCWLRSTAHYLKREILTIGRPI